MTPSETLGVAAGVFRLFLLNNVFSWTLFRHSAFVRFDKPIFEAEKPLRKRVHQEASSVGAALGKNAASFNLLV